MTDSVTDGQVTALPPIPEDTRLHYKDSFTRRQPPALSRST